ncbi:ATP-binding protein [Altericista sp. CCNU0014]|uniref:ATP-binding protein n=1 Tax=Altericista sp. CCNU0014 TaxID=3082949 RepID=UPI00384EA7A9
MTMLFALEIHYEQDVVQARQRTRELAEQLGFDTQDRARLATAVSEIARNAFQYAEGGSVEFYVEGDPHIFQIRVRDRGKGIPHLSDVLAGRYISPTGIGMGIVGTRRLMDVFEIESLPGKGTTILLGKALPMQALTLTDAQLQQIREAVMERSPQNPYEEIQRQNQELLQAMAELRKREEELNQLNRELEDTNRGVVALYAELDEKANSLQKANELKTRFFSHMSHEFRTPLNSILSLSRMLLARMDGDLTPEQEKQITFIQKAADGLSELVNDLLDLAKVEAGKIEVRPSSFTIGDLFGTLRGMLRPLIAQDSTVALIFEESDRIPPLYSDESKVTQILRNFISNALKFTERGEVRVKAAQIDGSVTFSVSDTGIGIAPEDLERIFEDFVQLESHVQRRLKGTGLGLPLSRKLAELLGGMICVESTLGKGSTFSLSLPTSYPKAIDTPHLQPPLLPLKPADLTVLAIGSHAETLLGGPHLQASRYEWISVRTLERARQVLQQLRPAVIVLDVLLESQGVGEFLQELEAEAATRTIPVLVVTSPEDEHRALGLGARVVLIKPIDGLTLLSEINSVISRGTTQRVLLIDDDAASRYVMKQWLAGVPVEILEAKSGREGLAIAQREQLTAIVLDLQMPEMSGFEVLDRLKRDPITQSIPTIVRSSTQLEPETQSSLAKQSIAILSKETTSQTTAIAQFRNALIKGGLVFKV